MTPAVVGARHPLVAVYADESCLGNGREGDNPGGAGVLVEWRHGKSGTLRRYDAWLSERATTNNRMALLSVIVAFTELSRKGKTLSVVFTSDSTYLITGMKEWVHGWAARGWTRRTGAIENLELWQQAVAVARPHEVEWRWVRGHHGHPQNEYANHLATRAARELTNSNMLVESGFDNWCETQRGKATLRCDVDPFPQPEKFRAARTLPQLSVLRS